ncbi:MAG: histidinol dehydrogenase, partial [Gammaproteobacteria bacterium]|nr:histidinol dehydrogenase [Gammaproteobacteria bacterium]
MMTRISNWSELDDDARSALLQRPALRSDAKIGAEVARIVALVRDNGDAAVRDLTEQFDGATLGALRVTTEELARATAELGDEAIAAIDLAIENVRRFHEPQLPQTIAVDTMPGVRCERVAHAIDSVGLYVPAGTAPLP